MASFKHFGHDHALEFVTASIHVARLMCMICNASLSKGYGCVARSCYFIIHKKCAELPQHIASHPLHTINNHSLTLSPKTFQNTHHNISTCCYCADPFSVGEYFTYSCDQHCPGFQMHATCGTVPLPTPIPSDHDHDVVVRFNCHQQPMTNLQDRGKANNIELLCFACRRPDNQQLPIYYCQSKDCDNFFHKSCADGLLNRISHPFHNHLLSLHLTKPRSCHSCHKKQCRLLYTCLENDCTFNLCTDCANYSTTTVQCRSHDHPFCLVERSLCDDNIRCQACLKSYNHQIQYWLTFPDEVVKTRSLLFRCLEMECSFDLHFLCGPLPVRVEYKYHIHPLNLVDSSTIKVDIDSDEYYCDACEEKRDPQFRVYHCADCKYVAHIHCVLFQIMKVIKADTKDVELKAVGENRWDDNFDTKLIINATENDSILTMRDVMSSLTEKDKQQLVNPRDDGNPFLKKQRINLSHTYGRTIDYCFDREKPTEDVALVQKFFNFTDYEYVSFDYELRCFRLEEGLRLDEKYLRQRVEDVNGYKVPKTVSPVLRTLLRKYGDLGGDYDLSPAMKSVCATFLCVTMDMMSKIKVEDLTRDDLRNFFFYLRGINDISAFQMDRYLESFKNIQEAFLGFEAIKFEKDVGEKLEIKVKTSEADLKRYKENRDKFKMYAYAEKSDRLQKCLSKASEWKGKYLVDDWF